jgi:hypothetical protein
VPGAFPVPSVAAWSRLSLVPSHYPSYQRRSWPAPCGHSNRRIGESNHGYTFCFLTAPAATRPLSANEHRRGHAQTNVATPMTAIYLDCASEDCPGGINGTRSAGKILDEGGNKRQPIQNANRRKFIVSKSESLSSTILRPLPAHLFWLSWPRRNLSYSRTFPRRGPSNVQATQFEAALAWTRVVEKRGSRLKRAHLLFTARDALLNLTRAHAHVLVYPHTHWHIHWYYLTPNIKVAQKTAFK